ncbi:MAG: hypothetical protein U9Q66_03100 [Patescibacteria group bacterium]|nr:hypothetical protein [Patescibacteria group bacterium]
MKKMLLSFLLLFQIVLQANSFDIDKFDNKLREVVTSLSKIIKLEQGSLDKRFGKKYKFVTNQSKEEIVLIMDNGYYYTLYLHINIKETGDNFVMLYPKYKNVKSRATFYDMNKKEFYDRIDWVKISNNSENTLIFIKAIEHFYEALKTKKTSK